MSDEENVPSWGLWSQTPYFFLACPFRQGCVNHASLSAAELTPLGDVLKSHLKGKKGKLRFFFPNGEVSEAGLGCAP